MYDKSKAEILNYIKEKDDEIKVLNSRIDILKETLEIKSDIVKDVKSDYSSMIWDIKGLEDKINNMKMDYSRMERKVKANSVMVYIQPFVWSACWFFMQWLLKQYIWILDSGGCKIMTEFFNKIDGSKLNDVTDVKYYKSINWNMAEDVLDKMTWEKLTSQVWL